MVERSVAWVEDEDLGSAAIGSLTLDKLVNFSAPWFSYRQRRSLSANLGNS